MFTAAAMLMRVAKDLRPSSAAANGTTTHTDLSTSTGVQPSGAVLYYSAQWSYPAEAWKRAVCDLFRLEGGSTTLDFRCFDPAHPETAGNLSEIHYALVYGAPAGLLAKLPNLRATLSISAGIDHVLSDPTYPRDTVPVLRMTDQHQITMMGHFAVHRVLDHHREMPAYRRQQRQEMYRRINTELTPPEIAVLVLGLGHMGREVACKLAGLGFQVRGWCRNPKTVPGVQCFTGRHSLLNAARNCMYVVNVLPLTSETSGILCSELFNQLKRGACVINIGRGGHLVEKDLLACLENGQLSHAYLDVFDVEPLPPHHRFWSEPGIDITPHVAGELLPRSCASSIAENIRKFSV